MKASGGALLVVVALGILWLVVTGRADAVLTALSGAAASSGGSAGGSSSSAFDDWFRKTFPIFGNGTSAPVSTVPASAPILQLNPLPAYPGYPARTA